MTQLFRHLLRAPRGVVVIDDLQWADDDSLELLALLVERVERRSPWSRRGPIDDAVPARRSRRCSSGSARRSSSLDVPAMPDGRPRGADRGPRAAGARRRGCAAAAALAAGSPYLAELIGRELGDADVAELRDAAELRRLERLAARRAHRRRDRGARRRRGDLRAAARVAELPSSRIQSALRGLEDARIVRTTPSAAGDPVYVFYHQRLREAAHDAISPPARRARHQRFAEWFERNAGDPGQLAYHWQRGGRARARRALGDRRRRGARGRSSRGASPPTGTARRSSSARADPLAARAGRASACSSAASSPRPPRSSSRSRAPSEPTAIAGACARPRRYLKLGEIERGLGVLDDVLARRGQRRARGPRGHACIRAVTVAARWLSPLPARRRRGRRRARRGVPRDRELPVDAVSDRVARVRAARHRARRARRRSRRARQGMAMLAAYLARGSLGRFGDRALATPQRLARERCAVPAHGRRRRTRHPRDAARRLGRHARARTRTASAICQRLGLERSWEASFLRSYWALGEYYAGEPARALVAARRAHRDRPTICSRARCSARTAAARSSLAGDLVRRPGARARARRHAGRAPRHGRRSTARCSPASSRSPSTTGSAPPRSRRELARLGPRAVAVGDARDLRDGRRDRGHRRARPRADRRPRRRRPRRRHRAPLYRRGRASFYAATALRLWGQAELRARRHAATPARILERAAAGRARPRRQGRSPRDLAALVGEPIDPGPLGPAVAWAPAARSRRPWPDAPIGRRYDGAAWQFPRSS